MSLTVASLLAVHAPASAGHWDPSYTYSGTTTWTVDGQPQGSKAWTSDSATWANTSNFTMTGTTQSQGMVTATITWHRDFVGDNAPTQVMVKQSAEAKYTWTTDVPPTSASGTANNGLSSPLMVFPTSNANGQITSVTGVSGGCKTLTFQVPAGATPSITLPGVSLSAQSTVTAAGMGTFSPFTIGGPNTVYVNCKYAVTANPVHAQPTNFHENIGARSNAGGTVHFEYNWDSSDGVMAHLNQVYIGEFTDREGNPAPPGGYTAKTNTYNNVLKAKYGYYYMPKPPYGQNGVQAAIRNPFIGGGLTPQWGTAERGLIVDTQEPPPFLPPYSQDTVVFNAHQVYGFRCLTSMDASEPPSYFEVLMSVGTITRTFAPNGNGWLYTVTKSGYSGTINK